MPPPFFVGFDRLSQKRAGLVAIISAQMAVASYDKPPEAKRTYTIPWLVTIAPAVKITTSTWQVPGDLTKVGEDFDDTTTTITLEGGTANNQYIVYNDIETDDGQSDRGAIVIRVVDAALISPPSQFETLLAEALKVLQQKAAKDTEEYQIANRMMRHYGFADFLEYVKWLQQRVNQERRAASGAGIFTTHYVRPWEPGP
jgi:hypothetical protein